jgi:hypothetical protein
MATNPMEAQAKQKYIIMSPRNCVAWWIRFVASGSPKRITCFA